MVCSQFFMNLIWLRLIYLTVLVCDLRTFLNLLLVYTMISKSLIYTSADFFSVIIIEKFRISFHFWSFQNTAAVLKWIFYKLRYVSRKLAWKFSRRSKTSLWRYLLSWRSGESWNYKSYIKECTQILFSISGWFREKTKRKIERWRSNTVDICYLEYPLSRTFTMLNNFLGPFSSHFWA